MRCKRRFNLEYYGIVSLGWNIMASLDTKLSPLGGVVAGLLYPLWDRIASGPGLAGSSTPSSFTATDVTTGCNQVVKT